MMRESVAARRHSRRTRHAQPNHLALDSRVFDRFSVRATDFAAFCGKFFCQGQKQHNACNFTSSIAIAVSCATQSGKRKSFFGAREKPYPVWVFAKRKICAQQRGKARGAT